MDIQAHISLADHAAFVGGKFYVNGGGWNNRPPVPVPWSLILEVRVPWHDNNRKMCRLAEPDGRLRRPR
jgi:hypothetical protein